MNLQTFAFILSLLTWNLCFMVVHLIFTFNFKVKVVNLIAIMEAFFPVNFDAYCKKNEHYLYPPFGIDQDENEK